MDAFQALESMKMGVKTVALLDHQPTVFAVVGDRIAVVSENFFLKIDSNDFLSLYRDLDFQEFNPTGAEVGINTKRDEEYYSWRFK